MFVQIEHCPVWLSRAFKRRLRHALFSVSFTREGSEDVMVLWLLTVVSGAPCHLQMGKTGFADQ